MLGMGEQPPDDQEDGAVLRSSHFGTSAYMSLSQGSEAQKGILGRRARLDDQTNQLNQWRGDAIAGRTHSGRFVSRTSPANHGFSCTSARRALAELHSERARTATLISIAGRDRQEMG